MRREFAKTLVELAEKDNRIILLTGDFESSIEGFKEKFPTRYYNMGTCEQTLISMASGMAIEGLIPVVYSITPFILERPFEQVKICIDQQNLPVILAGYDDYPSHGLTHAALAPELMAKMFTNIKSYFPKNSFETRNALTEIYQSGKPGFLRMKRDKDYK